MRRLLAVLFSAAPFVAAAIAALSDRRDMRMLWMAITATVVVRVLYSALERTRSTPYIAFVVAALSASTVAVLLGAHAAFGVIAVAVVLAASATLGAVLWRSH